MDKKNESKDIQSYIYQQLQELEPLLIEASVLKVYEKNAKKIIKKLKQNEEVNESFDAKYCYEFNLEENGSKINSYGLADSPYEAIKIASEKMLAQLIKIQDDTVTKSERLTQINKVLSKDNIKH